MSNRLRARIGCSGWQYKHWRGDFYPSEIPTTRWFEYYAARFDTVEINNSFYRLPEAETFAGWAERAPAQFLYAVKASRFLTHMKKLKDPDEPVSRLFERMRPLGRHLGPVLYQLPPGWIEVPLPMFVLPPGAPDSHLRHSVIRPIWGQNGVRPGSDRGQNRV